jgi:hypothetical protein
MIYTCCDELRRAALGDPAQNPNGLNGIDFLEVIDHDAPTKLMRQRLLNIHFVNNLSGGPLTKTNVLITGGERITNIIVTNVKPGPAANILTVEVNQPGDFSIYTLQLVQDAQHPQPPPGYDPILSEIDFSFKVECPSDFDCKKNRVCPPPPRNEPEINYLKANLGQTANPTGAEVTYVRGGKAFAVRANHCILACWNMVIPYLCPEMSDAQKAGLAYNVKVPLAYTNVQLRNWSAFEKLKIHGAQCPGGFFNSIELDFPVSIGEYKFPQMSDEPCLAHLPYVPVGPGATAREQQRTGRGMLLGMSFATFERNIRDQMSRVLGGGGFDPARDIEAITVNRWPHGYSYEYNSLYDPVWPDGQAPHEIGRKPFGRIHIANSDAGVFAYTNEAIDQGYRAVQEIVAKQS